MKYKKYLQLEYVIHAVKVLLVTKLVNLRHEIAPVCLEYCVHCMFLYCRDGAAWVVQVPPSQP